MGSNIKRFFYGFLIGVSNLIPGFSGGTMALILGIYEEFTGAISSITKHFGQAVKELWSLALGMILGIVVATITIVFCLKTWPVITASFFVGLVIATIPITLKKIDKRKLTIGPIISLIVCFVVSVLLPFGEKIGLVININEPNVWIILFVFIIAGIAAATMVIPAASGSLVLLAFGLFYPITEMLEQTLAALLAWDWSIIGHNLIILIPFGIGVIVGIIAIAKIISYLLNKHDLIIWSGILGLLFSSLFTIYYNAYTEHIRGNEEIVTNHLVLQIILSVIMLALGIVSLTLILKLANKKQKEEQIEEQPIE